MSFSLIYTAGAGRSGSTLLDLLLGNQPDMFSIGEARYFWEYWVRGDRLCGCGELLTECPFWGMVHARLLQEKVAVARVAQLASRYDRTRNLPSIAIRRDEFFPSELIVATGKLYQMIAETSRARYLIDSSKVPSHLELLSRSGLQDIRLLHLIRDSRAVAHSWSNHRKKELGSTDPGEKMPTKSPIKATVVWAAENIFASYFGKSSSAYARLRYEDLVGAPVETLTQTFESLGVANADFSQLRQATIEIRATHSVGGNPIRFRSGSITIRRDDSWRKEMARWKQIALGMPVGPLLRYFGYQL